jgi:hypothetical protein
MEPRGSIFNWTYLDFNLVPIGLHWFMLGLVDEILWVCRLIFWYPIYSF